MLRVLALPAMLFVGSAIGAGALLVRDTSAVATAEARAAGEAASLSLASTLAPTPSGELGGDAVHDRLQLWARANKLASCSVIGPDGDSVAVAAGPEPAIGAVSVETREPIPGHDGYQVVATSWRLPASGIPSYIPAAAAIAGGLIAAGVAFRTGAARAREMAIVSGALDAWAAGEREPEALTLGDMFVASTPWNDLVERASTGRSDTAPGADLSMESADNAETDRAFSALWHGLCLLDASGRILRANGAGTALLGFVAPGEVAGQSLGELLGDTQAMRVLDETCSSGGSRRRSVTVTPESGGGRSLVRVTARGLPGAGQAAAIVFLEDVTQQRAAESARNNFVAQATHELRTPLTNIRLHVEEAIDAGREDPVVVNHALNVISGESERLERTVNDMLNVSEIESGSLSLRVDDVRIDRVFESLTTDYAPQARERNQTLTWELPPKFPVIRGDREKIQLALHNVVGNALKYTPDGGTIRVRVEADESGLTVEITDTGMGIPSEDIDHIFDKFYRARGVSLEGITGSGLGLALAREVVRLHGGDITAESLPGEGSTFVIRIPSADTQAAAA